MPVDLDNVQKMWQSVTELMKKKTSSMALWQAMESAVVLDYEEPGVLVLGLAGENFSRSGHLQVPEHRNLIEDVMAQATRKQLSFRLVECSSREEWKVYKVHEERKRAAQMAFVSGQRPRDTQAGRAAPAPAEPAPGAPAPAPATEAQAAKSVDDILDQAYKLFAAQSHRTLAQSRARFVRDAAQMLAGAEGQLASAGMPADQILRTIDRAIDRIAVWGECDATTVALEYVRLKDRQ